MKYDFDTAPNRRGSGSLKWDVSERELPMWVADMDFATAPPIREALLRRVKDGNFGYTIIPDAWAASYIRWWERRYDFSMEKDWLVFATGIVPAISSMVRKLTTPNENVLIQTPVYNIFFNSIINNGARVLESPLVYENGVYHIDFSDLEEKLSDPQTTLIILCNPHNPIGKIWDKETLAKIGELCAKHHVTVISDEAHCDLTTPGKKYIPFQSVSETCRNISISCLAPSKTFSIPGLQTAAVSIPNPYLRHKVWRALNTDEVAEPNAFAIDATIAAYEEGEPWLDELLIYIEENKQVATSYIKDHIPELFVVPQDATYLMWIDAAKVCDDSKALLRVIRQQTGLYVSNGAQYGECGRPFFRLNVGCPRATLDDGLQRLAEGIEFYQRNS